MNPKDPRREPDSHISSSSSPSPEQSVRQLLTQLSQVIRSWTSAVTHLDENVGKLVTLVETSLVEKTTVLGSQVGTLIVDVEQSVERTKVLAAAFAGLRTLLADRNKGLGDAEKAFREATGSHPLQPREPEVRAEKWGFVKRLAHQSGPRILFFLVHFALASFGASKGLQAIIDAAISAAQGRS